MKNIKYEIVHRGDNFFVVKLEREYDTIFGMKVIISVFENHPIPKNRRQRIAEFFKYRLYHERKWYSLDSDITLREAIGEACAYVEQEFEKILSAEAQWENI